MAEDAQIPIESKITANKFELSIMTGLSPNQIDSLRKKKEITATKFGREYIYLVADIQTYLRTKMQSGKNA